MAIARTQAVSANASSVAITSTAANDVIVVFAYNNASTSVPTPPAGYALVDTLASVSNCATIRWKLSPGGETSTGAWSGATNIVCHVYSGLNTTTPIGGHTPTSGSSTALAYGSLVMSVVDGTSWIVGMAGAKSATAGMSGSTVLLTNRTSQTTMNGLDSGVGKTAYAGETLNVTTSGRWITETLEMLAAASGTTSGTVAGTDAVDVAAIATTVTTGAAVAATDTKDTAAVAASVTTGASIAATDARDTAAVIAANWTNASIAATDGADVAAVVAANWTNSAIAATDAGDGAALIATVSSVTSATIAATDAADQASIAAANWTTALLASIDAGDTAAIEASGGAATQRFVPGHKHAGGEYQLPRRRYRTEEEIRQRRIELGIIPAPVEKIVAKAARRVIAKAQAQARADSAQDFDALTYLQEHQAQQRANLAADLRKRQIQAGLDEQRTYMILLSIEVEAQVMQEREDEQILALLLEM